jgi:hypothetical protein
MVKIGYLILGYWDIGILGYWDIGIWKDQTGWKRRRLLVNTSFFTL